MHGTGAACPPRGRARRWPPSAGRTLGTSAAAGGSPSSGRGHSRPRTGELVPKETRWAARGSSRHGRRADDGGRAQRTGGAGRSPAARSARGPSSGASPQPRRCAGRDAHCHLRRSVGHSGISPVAEGRVVEGTSPASWTNSDARAGTTSPQGPSVPGVSYPKRGARSWGRWREIEVDVVGRASSMSGVVPLRLKPQLVDRQAEHLLPADAAACVLAVRWGVTRRVASLLGLVMRVPARGHEPRGGRRHRRRR